MCNVFRIVTFSCEQIMELCKYWCTKSGCFVLETRNIIRSVGLWRSYINFWTLSVVLSFIATVNSIYRFVTIVY
jgi:hypothetical protein